MALPIIAGILETFTNRQIRTIGTYIKAKVGILYHFNIVK